MGLQIPFVLPICTNCLTKWSVFNQIVHTAVLVLAYWNTTIIFNGDTWENNLLDSIGIIIIICGENKVSDIIY